MQGAGGRRRKPRQDRAGAGASSTVTAAARTVAASSSRAHLARPEDPALALDRRHVCHPDAAPGAHLPRHVRALHLDLPHGGAAGPPPRRERQRPGKRARGEAHPDGRADGWREGRAGRSPARGSIPTERAPELYLSLGFSRKARTALTLGSQKRGAVDASRGLDSRAGCSGEGSEAVPEPLLGDQ